MSAVRHGSGTGTAVVFSVGLRRERLALLIWVLALTGTVLSSVSAIRGLYPTAPDRAALVTSITTNPSFLALTGPVRTASVGGITAWRVGILGGVASSLMGIFTVIRRTRAEEESGRAELLASTPLGRDAILGSALLLSWGVALLVGLISAAGAMASGLAAGGSLVMGAGLAGPGLVFASLAAVTAQLFQNARTATACASAVLAAAMVARAAADLWPGLGWLGWVSPLGWISHLDPFGGRHWAVLGLFLATASILGALAVLLSRHRDLGLGLFSAGPGRAVNPRLRSGFGLAIRLQQASWLGWGVGFALLGLLTGSLALGAGSLIGGNERIRQLVQDLGGRGTVAGELLAALAAIAGLAAGAHAVSSALRLRAEETQGHAETLLATGLSRTRWWTGHLMISLIGSAALLVIAGSASGLVLQLATGDGGLGFGSGVAAMTVQVPAVLVIGAASSAVIAVLPRASAACWAVLGLAAILGQIGQLLGLPDAVRGLSPYAHVPALPVAPMTWTPMIVLLLIATAATGLGLLAINRRDIG